MSGVPEPVKYVGDGLAVAAWAGALFGVLTNFIGFLAAIASLVWGCIRIYETRTVQTYLKQRRTQ